MNIKPRSQQKEIPRAPTWGADYLSIIITVIHNSARQISMREKEGALLRPWSWSMLLHWATGLLSIIANNHPGDARALIPRMRLSLFPQAIKPIGRESWRSGLLSTQGLGWTFSSSAHSKSNEDCFQPPFFFVFLTSILFTASYYLKCRMIVCG